MPTIPVAIEHIGLAFTNQSNHSQLVLISVNSTDSFSETYTPTVFSTTQFTTTNTTTSPAAASEDSTSWIYISLGVLCWIAIFVGCGFAWTQLCKAFYHTSDTCGACARTCRRNPGVSWMTKTKFFRFYFGNDCCCCRENEDIDDEPVNSSTTNEGNTQTNSGVSEDRTASGNDSIPSTITNAPPPPYEVAIFMRRPGENTDNDEPTVTLSSLTDAQTLEQS